MDLFISTSPFGVSDPTILEPLKHSGFSWSSNNSGRKLKPEELLEAVRSVTELRSDHRQSLREFCQRADEVKFAQTLPPVNQLSQELIMVRSWLEQTRVVEEVSA